MAETIKPVQIGDIFFCSWGYDQTLVDWYQVVGVSKSGKSARFRQIDADEKCNPETFTGVSMPIKDKFTGDVFSKRLQMWQGELMLKGPDYGFMRPWNGKGKRTSSYA